MARIFEFQRDCIIKQDLLFLCCSKMKFDLSQYSYANRYRYLLNRNTQSYIKHTENTHTVPALYIVLKCHLTLTISLWAYYIESQSYMDNIFTMPSNNTLFEASTITSKCYLCGIIPIKRPVDIASINKGTGKLIASRVCISDMAN